MKQTERKRVLLLANPSSGQKTAEANLFRIISNLARENCETTVFPIIPSEGLTSECLVKQYKDDFDVIACCGGDGTLNHVMSAVVSCGIQKPIGYIPTGSTNDFARSLNNGKALTLDEFCHAISSGKTFAYDVGCVNKNHYFNYVAAFGAFTNVSYETPQDLKNVLGYSAYILKVIATIPDGLSYSVHMKFTRDGIEEEGDYIFGTVCNTTSMGGMQSPLISSSELNDGLMEVVLIRTPKNIVDLNRVLSTLASGDVRHDSVQLFTTDHIDFEFDKETAWTLDGEDGIGFDRVTVKTLKQAASILVDPENE